MSILPSVPHFSEQLVLYSATETRNSNSSLSFISLILHLQSISKCCWSCCSGTSPTSRLSPFLHHQPCQATVDFHLKSSVASLPAFPGPVWRPLSCTLKVIHHVFSGFWLNLRPSPNSLLWPGMSCTIQSLPNAPTMRRPLLCSGCSSLLSLLEKPDCLPAQSHCSCCLLYLESTCLHFTQLTCSHLRPQFKCYLLKKSSLITSTKLGVPNHSLSQQHVYFICRLHHNLKSKNFKIMFTYLLATSHTRS